MLSSFAFNFNLKGELLSGFAFNFTLSRYTAAAGNLDVLQFARENGCPW
jgi:hypothetical protein